MGMKFRRSFTTLFLLIAAALHGAAFAQAVPGGEGGEVTVRSWIDSLGVHFRSEDLFDEASPVPYPAGRTALNDLPGQADTAGLQGLGLVGDWRPFRNGFHLSFAMYLDSSESGGFRARKGPTFGAYENGPIPLSEDFDLIPYVGVGWRTNDGSAEGLGLNLDVGAFLPGDSFPLEAGCGDLVSAPANCEAASSLLGGRDRLLEPSRDFEWYPVASIKIEYRF